MDLKMKAHVFGRRLRGLSLGRMGANVRMIHDETGVWSPFIACDMVWCFLRYGVGYLDYHVFGFAKNRGRKRKTFMTMSHNIGLARMVNDPACYDILNDKFQFLRQYGDFIGRRWMDLRQTDAQGFAAFFRDCGTLFVKPFDDFGGIGVERIVWTEATDTAALYERLLAAKQFLAEQAICQHPQMARLCPASVNTLRIVTLVCGGKAHFVYSLLRMGSGKGHVDNISSGGLYTLAGPDGSLAHAAFCDKTGQYYTVHPATGTPIVGFTVPMFREAVDLCLRAALVEPGLGYVGWDVAITPDGPILVEGNNLPGYDMAQNHAFRPEGIGLLPTIEAILGKPVDKI